MLEKQVFEVYQLSAELKGKEEDICVAARLLFKPWSKKKKEKQADERDGDVKTELPSEVKVTPAPEVIMVEKALLKAQKTRTKYSPSLPVDVDKQTEHNKYVNTQQQILSNNNSTFLGKEQGTSQGGANDMAQEQLVKTNNTSLDNVSDIAQEELVDTSAVISQSKLNNLFLYSNVKVSKQHQEQFSAESYSKTKEQANLKARPNKLKQNPGNLAAAYTSAPYQTKIAVKKIRPGQTRAQMLRTNANLNKSAQNPTAERQSIARPSSGARQKVDQGLANYKPRHNSGSQVFKNISHSRKESMGISYNPSHGEHSSSLKTKFVSHQGHLLNKPNQLSLSVTEQRSNTVKVRHGQVISTEMASELDFVHNRKGDMYSTLKDKNTNNNANTAVEDTVEGAEELPFFLPRDGKKMKIPSKLSKLLFSNRKMREKLKSNSITKKAQEKSSAADVFLAKMDEYFAKDFPEAEYKSIVKRKMLCDTYKSLSVIFKDICKMSLSDCSLWTEILKAKRGMEYVLMNFTEVEEEFQRLCLENPTSDLHANLNTSPDQKSNIFWLPIRFLPDSFMLSNKVKYQNRKQLHKYLSLLHQMQLFLLEKHIMEQVEKQLLSFLKNEIHANLFNRDTVELYKSSYSFLCCHGYTFPVMVQDSDSDDENIDKET